MYLKPEFGLTLKMPSEKLISELLHASVHLYWRLQSETMVIIVY